MVDAKESTIHDHLPANYLAYSHFENIFDHIRIRSYQKTKIQKLELSYEQVYPQRSLVT